MQPRRLHGFTLIELSIVLVIIGLLIGGIVVGRDLIEAATIRAQISQVEKLNTTVKAFRAKYNCMPGDCATAVSYGLGDSAGWHNGNGNARIDAVFYQTCFYNYNNLTKDANNFFLHLSRSGLVNGSYEGYQGEAHNSCTSATMVGARFPRAALPQAYVYPSYFQAYAASMGGDPTYNSYLREAGNGFGLSDAELTPAVKRAVAQAIDIKIDDGAPLTGKVALGAYSPSSAIWQLAFYLQGQSGVPHSCVSVTYQSGCNNVQLLFVDQY